MIPVNIILMVGYFTSPGYMDRLLCELHEQYVHVQMVAGYILYHATCAYHVEESQLPVVVEQKFVLVAFVINVW